MLIISLNPQNIFGPQALLSVVIYEKADKWSHSRENEKLLHKLIGNSQKAYQSDKNIGNVMDIIETIALTKYHKTPAIILLVDFSKAFDSINQDYIFKTLEFFNFGQNFINIVKTMLKD